MEEQVNQNQACYKYAVFNKWDYVEEWFATEEEAEKHCDRVEGQYVSEA